MFVNQSELLKKNLPGLHYGVAVTDLDGDGQFEALVTGFGERNRVLKWDGREYLDVADEALADADRKTIGVAAADIDGDGAEEIYLLNTDTFAGKKQFGDRLFRGRLGQWEDLCADERNQGVLNLTAGRSVACVDRYGSGQHGFYVANYGGPIRFYELDRQGVLQDLAREIGLGYITGGRGVLSAPLISPRMDIFAANENSPNFLFRNRGDGTFQEAAEEAGLQDSGEHGRGVAVLDADGDGRFDLVCGNWEGPHRFFWQHLPGKFTDTADRIMAMPSRVRTVLAADFDNDGYEEIFFQNIGQPNRLFAFREGEWVAVETGEAWEPEALGTGGAYGDFDGDGRLELLLAHGESGPQPLSLLKPEPNGNHYLRVLPLTKQGAPARGAVVRLTSNGRQQCRAIDAGSGYLCQMEPVAHFGLGSTAAVKEVTVRWPDGSTRILLTPAADQTLRVEHP